MEADIECAGVRKSQVGPSGGVDGVPSVRPRFSGISGSRLGEMLSQDLPQVVSRAKVKMRALLVQQGCAVAMEGEDKFPKDAKEEVKNEIMAKAHSTILLSVTDEVLREVVDQTTTSELWDKLCEKYQNNSVTNRLYQKQRLYTLRVSKSTKGQIKGDCPQKKGNSKGESSKSGSATVVQDGSDDGDFGDVLTVCSASTDDTWIMDIGASYHMTFSHDLFTSFKEWNGTVKLGDDAVLFIKCSGIVQIKMHDGIVRKFDCWFVPGLKKILISLGTLAKNGLKYHGEEQFSYRNGDGIPGLLGGDVTGKIQFCEACVKGKQRRVKFSTGQHISKEILEDVTFDESDMLGQSRSCESFAGTKDCGADQKVEFDTPYRVVIEEEQQEKNNTDNLNNQSSQNLKLNQSRRKLIILVIGLRIPWQSKKGKNAPRSARYAGCVNTYDIDSVAYALASFKKNKTWDLVTLPKGVKPVGCKWVLKIKEGIPSVEPARFKARLLAKGFLQKEGIDYHKVFSPVVKHKTIRVLLAMVGAFNLKLEQLNVKLHSFMLKMAVINDLKAFLKSEFEMKDLGAAKKILDLAHAVSVVSRFMANPGKTHWKAVKWIFLKGASNICLVHDGTGHSDGMVGYADSDYGGDLVKRRPLTCFICTLFGCAVSWKSTLQPTVALSATEGEYISMTEGIKECGLVQSWEVKSLRGSWCRKETTKRDTEEPLEVRDIPSQGGDCCLSDLDLTICYPK
nr:retrovirus-related Pol polyprotein from transposon TNT 1-94 [Tanacetum cinerariifolium]